MLIKKIWLTDTTNEAIQTIILHSTFFIIPCSICETNIQSASFYVTYDGNSKLFICNLSATGQKKIIGVRRWTRWLHEIRSLWIVCLTSCLFTPFRLFLQWNKSLITSEKLLILGQYRGRWMLMLMNMERTLGIT